MALKYNGTEPSNVRYNGQQVNKVTYNGQTVWQAEKVLPGWSIASFYNYVEYHTTKDGVSSTAIDARGYTTATFTYSITCSMMWSNPNGVSSTTTVYLQLQDGTRKQIAVKSGTLYTAGSTYTASAEVEVDLSGYTETQKSSIKLYATLGSMSAPNPQAGSDRHDVVVSTGQVTLSQGGGVSGNIYGVSWDKTASTVLSRTDDAALFAEPVPYVAGAESCSSPFDALAPWSGMTVVEDEEAGTMVRIPKFWYKWTDTAGSLKLQIATYAAEGFLVSPAHADRGDGAGERDEVLIGRYHCSAAFKSDPGAQPLAGKTLSECRTGVHALGSNVWLMDNALIWTVRMLYLVEYANWNSQSVIGYGCGNGTAAEQTGYTDSMSYHTGTTMASRTAYGCGTQYRNIEGLWDNVMDWVDGVSLSTQTPKEVYYYSNPSLYGTGSGRTLITSTDGTSSQGPVIKAWKVSSAAGYEYALWPSDEVAWWDGYITDGYTRQTVSTDLATGGNYTQETIWGMFCFFAQVWGETTLARVGCRLQKLN